MNQETMLAFFDDAEARDKAVAAAKEQRVQVVYIGDAKPVLNGDPSTGASRPFILSRGGMMGGIVFMQHGAVSCIPI